MARPSNTLPRALAAAWFMVLAAPSLPGAAAAQQPAPPPPPYTYQGTVQAVRPKPGELDLLTGVGEALRIVHLRVVPATQIVSAGQPIRLAQLEPGDIVRTVCRQTDAGLVADQIEKLGHQGPPGEQDP